MNRSKENVGNDICVHKIDDNFCLNDPRVSHRIDIVFDGIVLRVQTENHGTVSRYLGGPP